GRFRPPDRPSAPPPSLPRPAEVEPHEQHVRRPAVGKRAERLAAPRVLDRALRFEIEPEAAGPLDELHVADRPVAVDQVPDFRIEPRALLGALPPARALRDGAVGVGAGSRPAPLPAPPRPP